MGKKFKYMIFISFLFLMLIPGVSAAEDAKCVYTLNDRLNADIVVTITDGSIGVKLTGSGYTLSSGASNLAQINFQSNNKWKCPSAIYWKMGTSSGRTANISEITAVKKDGYATSNLNSTESSDGKEISSNGEDKTTEKTLSCQYGNLIITYGSSTFKYNKPCTNTSVKFDQKNLSLDECPDKVYKTSSNGRGGEFCVYSLSSSGGSSVEIKLNEDEPIPDADGNDDSNNSVEQPGEVTDKNPTVGCDILGGANSKTVKLLSWGVKLIRLGIPIIIIIFGMVDFLTILFSGEDKTYKDAFSKFIKRILIGIIIIFLPYVIHFLVRLSGVDRQYGIDNFYCGIIDTVSGVRGDEVDIMEADPEATPNEETKTCYICQDENGNYSQHWVYSEPKGYDSCYNLVGQTEDTCLHG